MASSNLGSASCRARSSESSSTFDKSCGCPYVAYLSVRRFDIIEDVRSSKSPGDLVSFASRLYCCQGACRTSISGHANLLVSAFYLLCVSIYSNSRGVFCPHAATQRSIKPLTLSQGGPALTDIRSMASQNHPRRDTSPNQPRVPRRTSVACCRCRGRKVKCAPLEHEPNRTCQRCLEGALPCEYMSVADEERRTSRDPGFLEHSTAAPDGPSMTQSPAMVQQWYGGGMTSSSTLSSGASFMPGYDATPPAATAYNAPSFYVDYPQEVYTHDMEPASYGPDGGPWSQQLQATQLQPTPGYIIYDQTSMAYGSNQEVRPGIADRKWGFRDYNNDQDDDAQPEDWYDGT